MRNATRISIMLRATLLLLATAPSMPAQESSLTRHWLWSQAHAIPYETTSEQSGYFSIVEGQNGKVYIGTAKYGDNAYLVEYSPDSQAMQIVLDAEKEIGVDRKGFAAQAKFHTRNNVGRSGKIYLGTKQGYPKEGENPLGWITWAGIQWSLIPSIRRPRSMTFPSLTRASSASHLMNLVAWLTSRPVRMNDRSRAPILCNSICRPASTAT